MWDPCGSVCFSAGCAKLYNKPFLLILQQVNIYCWGDQPVSQALHAKAASVSGLFQRE